MAHSAASFGQNDGSGSNVPRFQILHMIGIALARGHVAQGQGGTSETPGSRGIRGHLVQSLHILVPHSGGVDQGDLVGNHCLLDLERGTLVVSVIVYAFNFGELFLFGGIRMNDIGAPKKMLADCIFPFQKVVITIVWEFCYKAVIINYFITFIKFLKHSYRNANLSLANLFFFFLLCTDKPVCRNNVMHGYLSNFVYLVCRYT